jgi:hypothetical protein
MPKATAPVIYEPSPGIHISKACREAVALADRAQRPVAFDFNDTPVIVEPGEDPKAVGNRWMVERDRSAETYRNSPEGKAAEAEAAKRLRTMQLQTDDLIARLPGVVKDLAALVRWCVELSKSADYIGVMWPRSEVIRVIEDAGWQANAHVEGGRVPSSGSGRHALRTSYPLEAPMPRDRARLSKVRHHLREALGNLPDGDRDRDIKHWRPLLTTMIAGVDEMIGPEDEPEQAADADLPDGWHGGGGRAAFLDLIHKANLDPESLTAREKAGLRSVFAAGMHPKADPMPDERSLARAAEPPDREAEVEAAIGRIANDPDNPGWDDHEREC